MYPYRKPAPFTPYTPEGERVITTPHPTRRKVHVTHAHAQDAHGRYILPEFQSRNERATERPRTARNSVSGYAEYVQRKHHAITSRTPTPQPRTTRTTRTHTTHTASASTAPATAPKVQPRHISPWNADTRKLDAERIGNATPQWKLDILAANAAR